MNSQRTLAVTRWTLALGALAGIVLVYHRWVHVNPTTVSLSLLLLILLLAAEWGLRYAVVVSLLATAAYNFFFLPPLGTFTINDPQNWLALFTFLATAMIASRLSERARDEATAARARQRELEILLRLSRELLQSDSAASLLTSVPSAVASITEARGAILYLADGDHLYQAGDGGVSEVEFPHLRRLTSSLANAVEGSDEIQIPVRSGVRPRGVFILRGAVLSPGTADAIGGLISVAIDRVQALESVARGEAAKESERLRTLMIDSITHELRTPLTSIKGAATTLLDGHVQPEESHELLTIINEESDRLNRLVSEAVEMAQLDTQQVQVHYARVRVADAIATARETYSWIEEQHPLHLEVPENLEVNADPAMLQKILSNLLENAAKYSKHGEPITVSAERQGENLAISVADRGVGIDPAEQTLIFERFYRGRSHASGTSGTGMGLAISRAIAEVHGGTIKVTSQRDRGSVFTLLLPVDGTMGA